MAPQTTIVVYKPHSKSTKEYMVILDDEAEYKKWVGGDKSIAPALFTNGSLFASETGSQGKWLTPSAGEINTDFFENPNENPEAEDDGKLEKKSNKANKNQELELAVNTVLTKGHVQSVKHIGTGGSDMNGTRGGGQSTGNIGGGR